MDSVQSSVLSLNPVDKQLNDKTQELKTSLKQTNDVSNLVPNNIYTRIQKILLTTILWFSLCVEGMQNNMAGPTLLHMGYLLDTSVSLMSLTFTIEWCGYFVGCVISGIIYPKFNEEFQSALVHLVMCITTTLCPFYLHM